MNRSMLNAATAIALVAVMGEAPSIAAPFGVPANQGADCKLHVWSKPYVDNSIVGMFPGGLLGEAAAGNIRGGLARGKSTVTKDLISSEMLLDALSKSNLLDKLKIQRSKIVIEPDDTTYKPFLKNPVINATECQYGFRFNMVQFQQSTFYGKRLILYYVLIDRSASGKPVVKANYNIESIKAFDSSASDEQIFEVLKDGVMRVLNDIASKNVVVR